MWKAVVDTTVLVSALLNPHSGGASYDLLEQAAAGAFELVLSDEILAEAAEVLISRRRLRQRFSYSDEDVREYCRGLALLARVVERPPPVRVVRDPEDDMVLACALAATADFVVSRDDDLLSLGEFNGIRLVSPEAFLSLLRTIKPLPE